MTRYAVIADDLTGAGDTGVQFTKAGLTTRILMENWQEGALEGATVVVAQTDSRAMSPEDACAIVSATAKRLAAAGIKPLYKKVDSTLRGQIGSEIDAMMDVWNIPLALLCPAFPANGRTLVGGYLLVGGELVSRTPIGVDPVSPVRESHIPTLLAAQSKRKVHSVSSRDLDQGKEHLKKLFGSFRQAGGIVVADATNDADLALLEEALHEAEPEALYIGSAGLAVPLASRMAKAVASRKPVLAVVGSVNPVTRGQLKLLQQEGAGLFLITAAELLADEAQWKSILEKRAAELAKRLKDGLDTAVATPGNREEVESLLAEGKARGIESRTLTSRIAERTTGVAHTALGMLGAAQAVEGLILTGGDIAQAMLDHFGATGINLLAEVSPGIPMGTLEGAEAQGVKIITKAGGFGAPDALVKAARLLRESR